MTELFAETALLPGGWAQDVRIAWDEAGWITTVETGVKRQGPVATGPVLPGLTNLHSHSFQRAMAGRAERFGSPDDSFWTWREVMYGLALRLGPEEMATVARHLAIECLKGGYTGICEFHYVHRDPDGRTYDDPAILSRSVVDAYRRSGISVTHLPVLYATGGFEGTPLGDRQRRFRSDPELVLAVGAAVRKDRPDDPDLGIGIAPHSLRAAPVDMIVEAVTGLHDIDRRAPVHIHIAEQIKEVADCEAATGRRPVAYLFDELANGPPDDRWCLIHATHLDATETGLIAGSGAVAGLCPVTEANLGDGLFPIADFRALGGTWGIGSDSHAARDAAEELRLLEYGQRLTTLRRNIVADRENPSVGGTLWREAAKGGARASGRDTGRIAAGARADLIVLDGAVPDLAGCDGDDILDAYIFAGVQGMVRDVHVGGREVLTDGRHAEEQEAAAAFRDLLSAV